MIVSVDQLRVLQKFGKIEVTRPVELRYGGQVEPCPLAVGKQYKCKKAEAKASIVATVESVTRDGDRWLVVLAKKPIIEEERLLGKTIGYTNISAHALHDAGAAVPEDYQNQLCANAEEQNRQIQLAKLAEAKRAMHEFGEVGGPRASWHAKMVKRQIERAAKDLAA